METGEIEPVQRDLRALPQHVAAIGGEAQLQQAAGEARAFVDDRKEAARGHIEPLQCAAQEPDRLAHEPMALVGDHRLVDRQHVFDSPARLQRQSPDLAMVRAQHQQRVVQFARHHERPPAGAGLDDLPEIAENLVAAGTGYGHLCDSFIGRNVDLNPAVAVAALVDQTFERREGNAGGIDRPIAFIRPGAGPFFDQLPEASGRRNPIYQLPCLGAIGAHPFGSGAKDVGEITPHLALVDQPGEAAGAGQHRQERHFGQADGARPVVDHDDLVTGERQLIAAAGAGPVYGGNEFETRMGARILDAVAGLVGESAEINLFGVARLTQHVNVGAGAEHALLAARDHHHPGFGMLKPDAVERIVEFYIDPEVVRVELQAVTWGEPAFLLDVERQRGHRTVAREAPVSIALGFGVKVDHRKFNACSDSRCQLDINRYASFCMRKLPPSGLDEGVLKLGAWLTPIGGDHERRGESRAHFGRRRCKRLFRQSGHLGDAFCGSSRPG